ncbi:acetyl-CoA acetyltransferase [Geodermatophilus sp. DSM 44513]|uniref:acetyl-CoA acetyltransferase n=1 Tax=Geodermatophilus sp. DSM 44513 TaxID=1528104 RepID=UPI00127E6317|nr:acetyl-CoA acetyltransferase [Geodermatophilus sp. DSM 44513]WNV76635.1 acetyl-CoA acetyltransferase [Geodermatophilus sp. DSM 44513]
MGELRSRAAVVGVGEDGIGLAVPGSTPLDLVARATRVALDDAGLAMSDVDGLFTASAYYQLPALNTGEYLGLRPRYTDSTALGGSSFVAHVGHAAAAIAAGLCDVALVVYGSTQRSDSGRLVSQSEASPHERPYRPRYPVTSYALAAARHMYEFGTTREQLAAVAVAARQWAQLNPAAFARDPLTVDEVLSSRTVSSPLTVRDCCLVTDGGGALLVTSTERAADLRRPPVHLLGYGEAQWHRNITHMPDLTVTAAVDSGRRAYEQAGLSPSDVDLLELYDAFTINPILFLEDLGFCAKGEGGELVASGAIAPGGGLPVNTNGGGLSCCHPGMYGIFALIEAVRQLRGEAGERQVPGDVALVHGNGGVLSSQVTAIFGTSATQ